MMSPVDPSQGGMTNNVFGLADVEPQKPGDQVEEGKGFLDQLGKDVTVTLPKLKVSSDKKSKDFSRVSIRVSMSARKVMVSEDVKTELRDTRNGTVVKKLKSLASKVWRFLSGKRWKKIPDAKREEILKPLSDKARGEVKAKMDAYDKAVDTRKSLKAEWKGLAQKQLEYKHDFGIALEMYKVAMGKGGEIPHAKGLIFAVPANNDGSEKEYIQLGENSEAVNLRVANQIAQGLKNHPSFEAYLAQEARMNEIEVMRDGLLKELKGLEAEIPGLVKGDAKDRGTKRKAEASGYIGEAKKKKIEAIENLRDAETAEMDEDINFAEPLLAKLVTAANDLQVEVDGLKRDIKDAKQKLKDVNSDISTADKTKDKRMKTEIGKSGMNSEGLAARKTELEAQIAADEKTLGEKSQDLTDRRAYIAQETKALNDRKAEPDVVVKQAESRKSAAEKQASKEFKRHSNEIDADGDAEVSNTKKVVTGRPKKRKAPKAAESQSTFYEDVNAGSEKKPKSNLYPVGDLEKLQRENRTEEEDLDALRKWGGVEE